MDTLPTIKDAIERCQEGKDVSEVVELDLSFCQCPSEAELFKLIEGYSNLKRLTLRGLKLKTLDGFPHFQSLEDLDMSENDISTLETLAPLAKLGSLHSVSLRDCAVTSVDNFDKKCFALLPNLSVLDGYDRSVVADADGDHDNGVEAHAENGENESDDEGDDSEEEIGIEALQRSGDLDDEDEEDYNPDDEADLDECDDDFDDEEDNDVDEDDNGADLSGADVTGPRRPTSKRNYELDADNHNSEATAPKVPATEDSEGKVTNGTTQ